MVGGNERLGEKEREYLMGGSRGKRKTNNRKEGRKERKREDK